MAAKARDVTPLIARLRNFLIQRPYNQALRFEADQAARTQEPPNLPPGVSSKLADNYYLTRDARRSVQPPLVIYDGAQTLLAAGEKGDKPLALKAPPVPGIGIKAD